MCGLLGFQFKTSKTSQEQRAIAFAALASLMDSRGGDSWGVWDGRKTTKGIGMLTRGVNASTMARHESLMGHTRYATTGAVTTDNAHPFELRTIIGAHNGMVYNHGKLNSAYQRSCAVDSMHLFLHLEENAPLDEIEAYGAVAFAYRDDPLTFFLSRFNDGELAIAYGKWGALWASTAHASLSAMHLAGLKGKCFRPDDGATLMLREGNILTVDFPFRPSKSATKRYKWDDVSLAEESYYGMEID